VLEGSVSHNVRRTVTAPVDMNAVTASGVSPSMVVQQTVTASMRCAILHQSPTPHVNTAMPMRTPVYQGAQMTACVPLTIQSVGMVVDLTSVAAVRMRTVERKSCVILTHTNVSPNL